MSTDLGSTIADDKVSDPAHQARGAGINLLTLLAQGAMPAFHVQLARFLGASYGLYIYSNLIVDITSAITLFGMDLGVSREVALAREAKDEARAIRTVGTALRLVLLTGLCVSIALGLGAHTIAARANMPGIETPLRILTLVPIAYHASTIFLVATQSRGIMKYDFWTRGILQPLCLLASTSILLRLGLGVGGAAAGVAGAMIATAIFAALCFGRVFPLNKAIRATFTGPWDREVIRIGLPMTFIALLWSLQGRVDNLVLGKETSAFASGAYGACALYAITVGQMRNVFIPGVNAKLPELLVKHDREAMNEIIQRTQRWTALLATPLVVLFVVFGHDLLTIFGSGFPEAAPALALLSISQLFGAMSIPAQTIVLGSKRGASVVAGVASLVVQAALLLPMVHRYGMLGAAGTAALGMLVAQVVQQSWAYRLYGVHGFSWGLARVYLSALIAAVPGKILLVTLPLDPFPRFIVSVGAAVIVYLAALGLLGLAKEERAWAVALIDRARAFGRKRKA